MASFCVARYKEKKNEVKKTLKTYILIGHILTTDMTKKGHIIEPAYTKRDQEQIE